MLLFVVAIVQVSLLSSRGRRRRHAEPPARHDRRRRAPARLGLRRARAASSAGCSLDTANLETLGLTSLVLTVGGYWIGRYGETTGRDRTHAPFVSVAVVTVLYAVGVLVAALPARRSASPARRVLLESLVPTIAFNLILTAPVYWLVTKLSAAARLARARGRGAPAWLARQRCRRSSRPTRASRSRTA